METCNTKKNELISFYGLRGYAILMIMLSHCSGLLTNGSGRNLLDWWGAFGVSIFIVQSGFLGARKYDNTYDISFKNVLSNVKRKVGKFYWLHIFTLVLSLPLAKQAFCSDFIKTAVALILNTLMLQSFVPLAEIFFSFNAVSWYLTLVIVFEIAAPYVAAFLLKLDKRKIVFILSASILCQGIILLCSRNFQPAAHWVVYVSPITRLVDYVFGGGICLYIPHVQEENLYIRKARSSNGWNDYYDDGLHGLAW